MRTSNLLKGLEKRTGTVGILTCDPPLPGGKLVRSQGVRSRALIDSPAGSGSRTRYGNLKYPLNDQSAGSELRRSDGTRDRGQQVEMARADVTRAVQGPDVSRRRRPGLATVRRALRPPHASPPRRSTTLESGRSGDGRYISYADGRRIATLNHVDVGQAGHRQPRITNGERARLYAEASVTARGWHDNRYLVACRQAGHGRLLQRRWPPRQQTGSADRRRCLGRARGGVRVRLRPLGRGRLVVGAASNYDVTAGKAWVLVPVALVVGPELARQHADRAARSRVTPARRRRSTRGRAP